MTDVTPDVSLVLFPPRVEGEDDVVEAIAADPVARYRNEDGDWAAGVRPPNVIETVEDVAWAIDHREGAQVRLVCCFCGDDRAARTIDEGQRWFRTHACDGEGVPIDQWLAA